MLKKIFLLNFAIIFILSFFITQSLYAQQSDIEQKIKEYESKLTEIRQQKNTLSSQIQYMDTQIYLTGLKIQQTEEKIKTLSKEIDTLETKIEGLDDSLNYLSKILLNKIVQSYKQKRITFLDLLIDVQNAEDLIKKLKYINSVRNTNQKLLIQVQQTKINFEEQKNLREQKKKELDELKITLSNQQKDLNNQKLAKQKLLIETQNNETIYQNLLAKAQAEYAAIKGIIAGGGIETKIKDVKKGDLIATIIPGPSCNSSGSHLHFMVKENDSVQNPFNYLKNIDFKDYSGGDLWNPSGSWDWPIQPPIEFNQGYGYTWAIRNTWVGNIYNFHNGIDIFGSSYNVYAVEDGTLYRGSYSVGCALLYVKLVHKNSNISTYYLHTYPIN
ncbi:MAG: hypothetical protein KatS3mg092_0166 [Patescibacteria group bacterium]|nr:MAG: hypothetical protein KatS3mg092_0166 [Patescibacteria group bacterium]